MKIAVQAVAAGEQPFNLGFDDVANSIGLFEIKGSKTLLVGLGNGNALKISGGFEKADGYSGDIVGAPRSQYQNRAFRRVNVDGLSLTLSK